MEQNRYDDHYNARGLTPELIAQSFVAPSQFSRVASEGNSVLVGPRGSGKTTLLRMLDPRALLAWDEAKRREEVSPKFIGIFVPIDAAWVSSLRNAVRVAGAAGSQGEEEVLLAIYSLSVARSLVDVMRWRMSGNATHSDGFKVPSNKSAEADLVGSLANLWLPGQEVRSAIDLRHKIAVEIATLPRRWRAAANSERASMVASWLNPLELVAGSCDAFNTLFDDDSRKWALLCDELEIAPTCVQQLLFMALRAAPQNVLLKLALTPMRRIPFSSVDDLAVPAHDYEVVPLSYPTREEGAPERDRESFCVELWRRMVEERFPGNGPLLESPYKVFEEPIKPKNRSRASIDARSVLEDRFGPMFRELAEKDPSFSAYLNAKQVTLLNLDDNSQDIKDSVIRKVRPLVEVRNHFLAAAAKDGLRRTPRRTQSPYCGASRIFALSEGHPRWLKYSIGSMLSNLSDKGRIKVSDQSREIGFSVERIEARVRALPTAGRRTAYGLLSEIGKRFSDQVLGPTFRADPYLSFVVDDDRDEDLIGCLEGALYLGAVVPMHSDIFTIFTSGLVGKRFRLSNWLAPAYKLPLVAGKSLGLSALLGNTSSEVELSPQIALGLENGR